MATTAHGCHGRMPAGAGVRLRPYPQSATELTPGGSAPTPFPRLLTNALEVSDGSPHAPLGMKFRCAVAGCSFRSNRSHNFKRHTMTHTGATVSRRSARVYTVPADVGQEGGLPRTESVPSLACLTSLLSLRREALRLRQPRLHLRHCRQRSAGPSCPYPLGSEAGTVSLGRMRLLRPRLLQPGPPLRHPPRREAVQMQGAGLHVRRGAELYAHLAQEAAPLALPRLPVCSCRL